MEKNFLSISSIILMAVMMNYFIPAAKIFASVPIGFDPGMKLRRVASPNLSAWNYFESCPDGPDSKCAGQLANGGGFYTLGAGCFENPAVQCRMNSGEWFYPLSGDTSWGGKCPLYFNWKKDGDAAIASMKIDPRDYDRNWATDFYIGLQQNITVGNVYGGIDYNNQQQTPFLKNIDKITFKVRAKLCYSKYPNEDPRAGSVFTYIGFVTPRLNNQGGQFAVQLFDHKNTGNGYNYNWFTNSMDTEFNLCGEACKNDLPAVNEGRKSTIIINGKYLGIIPQNYNLTIDNTPDCSLSIENVPWLSIEIPVQTVIRQTLAAGYFSSDLLDGARFIGGIMAGTEFWGRALVELEVKDYTIWGSVCAAGDTNGCQACRPDGSGWIDDNSKCPNGQICKSGICTTNAEPTGYSDSADCENFTGWVCDADNYRSPLDVHFYADGKPGQGGIFLNSTTANLIREKAVGDLCGDDPNHGFSFATPINLKDGKQHAIYAYAINIPTGNNPLLTNSPKAILCQIQTCQPSQTQGCEICIADGSGWQDDNSKCASSQTCQNGICVANPPVCTPNCANKSCENDGCGGSCGTCSANQICNVSGQCVSSGAATINVTTTNNTTNTSINTATSPTTNTKLTTKMARAEILQRIAQIKQLLIQLIYQLIVELQKQLAAIY